MTKPKRDDTTEARILVAARKIFLMQGMAGARMQDIADAAGINKALLHYYFRNKEMLFETIFLQAAAKLFPTINEVFNSDLSLFEKIERFCDEYITVILEDPYLPLFVLNEINRNPHRFVKKMAAAHSRPDPGKFLAQLEREIRKGTIRPVSPLHLLLNLVSMTIFPFVGGPMMQVILHLDPLQFRMAMEQRKKEIPAFIIQSIKK